MPKKKLRACVSSFAFQMPGFGVPLKVFLVAGVILPTLVNLLSSVIVVFTEGKGKNGSTVAVSEPANETDRHSLTVSYY